MKSGFIEREICMKKLTIEDAKTYMSRMASAIRIQLVQPNSMYHGLDGHKRLARECGYALNDFDEAAQNAILSASYSTMYVRGCNLKPLLDAKEWIGIMRQQIEKDTI